MLAMFQKPGCLFWFAGLCCFGAMRLLIRFLGGIITALYSSNDMNNPSVKLTNVTMKQPC